jgi:hypothetical protein
MELNKMLISPAYAKELLENNTANRRANKDFVHRYANDMKEGRWNEGTGETIKIASDGTIIDGQHRLMAVIMSKKPIYFIVAKGVDKSVMTVIDTGKSRNATDVFSINKIENYNKIPSMISLYESLKMGYQYTTGTAKKYLTNDILLSLYNERPNYWQQISKTTTNWYMSFSRILSPSLIGGLYATFKELDEDMAYSFFSMLCSGMDVTNKSIILLRNRLIQDKMSNTKMQLGQKIALIIKVWNFYRTDVEAKVIKYNPSVEDFPTAQ